MAEPQPTLVQLSDRVERLEQTVPRDRLCMCVFSGELDRQIAALIIATGAAASGMEVHLFYTFWGTTALRHPRRKASKSLMGRLFGWMLPRGSRKLKLSRMQMMGLGPVMIRRLMKNNGTASLEELFEVAGELDVQIHVCSMSMELLEFQRDEFVDYPALDFVGVSTFIELTSEAKSTLFV